MSARSHDYDMLRREFLADPNLSIRELCRRHDIRGYSSVAQYARENGWYELKDRIKQTRDDKVIARISDDQADQMVGKIEALTEDWLTVTQAALYRFAEQLRNPDFRVAVDDLTKLMDKGLVLTGQPSSRTEERHFALSGNLDGLPAEFTRRLAAATRSGESERNGDSRTPSPSDQESRAN
jgi:hypothetical protein